MYQSPIEVIQKQIRTKIATEQENQIFKAVLDVGVNVDKDELIKALKYDRGQYERGYADGLLHRADEWISVDERLPEEGKNVLCIEGNKTFIAFMEAVEDCGTHVPVFWDWVAYDRDDTWNEVCPTHWMPLPDPPKMEGEE